jgi:hypothetical protein
MLQQPAKYDFCPRGLASVNQQPLVLVAPLSRIAVYGRDMHAVAGLVVFAGIYVAHYQYIQALTD